ncbi:hypothetical protein KDL44_11600 [bacterium]|nr:hypothetical protein [bacterium]
MWKGLAWLMLLYGLLATAAAVDAGDKQKGLNEMLGSWTTSFAELKERMAADGIEAPPMQRFEGHDPLAAASSGASLEISEDGNESWLDWTPARGRAQLDLLGLMLRPGPPDANGLALELRGSYTGQVVIGVLERDGSNYTVFPERLETDWTGYEIPLDVLTLGDDSEDENERLDVEQIEAVIIGYIDLPERGKEEGPRVISIDNLNFRRFRDNPLFPDFERGPALGEGGAGPGGGPGMRDGAGGPGMGEGEGPLPGEGQRPRDRLREKLKQRREDAGE